MGRFLRLIVRNKAPNGQFCSMLKSVTGCKTIKQLVTEHRTWWCAVGATKVPLKRMDVVVVQYFSYWVQELRLGKLVDDIRAIESGVERLNPLELNAYFDISSLYHCYKDNPFMWLMNWWMYVPFCMKAFGTVI